MEVQKIDRPEKAFYIVMLLAALAVIAILALPHGASAQTAKSGPANVISVEHLTALDDSTTAAFWKTADAASKTVATTPVGALVVSKSQMYEPYRRTVWFVATQTVKAGSIVAARYTLPLKDEDGNPVTSVLGAYYVTDDYYPGSAFVVWDGGFGTFWPGGQTDFEVYVLGPLGPLGKSAVSVGIYAADVPSKTVHSVNVIDGTLIVKGNFDTASPTAVLIDWYLVKSDEMSVTRDQITIRPAQGSVLYYLWSDSRLLTVQNGFENTTRPVYIPSTQ